MTPGNGRSAPGAEAAAEIEFRRLTRVPAGELLALLNDDRVRRHMPLAQRRFTAESVCAWVEGKDRLWSEHGYGPVAVYVDGVFAGWCGFQPEDGDPDLAIVLRPDFWGLGRRIHEAMIDQAFGELGLASVTALLPYSRSRVRGMERLGYEYEGSVWIDGSKFMRFRRRAAAREASSASATQPLK